MTKKELREEIMSDKDRIKAWQKRGKHCRYCYGERPIETITDRLLGCCKQCAERDSKAVAFKKLPCVCCGKPVEVITDDEVTVNTVDTHGFAGGMAARISGGYGSLLDTHEYIIAICDDCVNQKSSEGMLINIC